MSQFTQDEYMQMSLSLENVIAVIIKKLGNNNSIAETFININNKLFQILVSEEYQNNYIPSILCGFKVKLKELEESINDKQRFMELYVNFEFILQNLNTLFPNGCHIDEFVLEDIEAEKWWQKNFRLLIFVEPERFMKSFQMRFSKLIHIEEICQSICFSKFGWFHNISKCNFNIFLRFYGGWVNLEDNWIKIHFHKANLYMITYETGMKNMKGIECNLRNIHRSIDKSYLFFMNFHSTEGLWYILYGKNGKIEECLIDGYNLLKELSDTSKFLYSLGTNMDDINENESEEIEIQMKINPRHAIYKIDRQKSLTKLKPFSVIKKFFLCKNKK